MKRNFIISLLAIVLIIVACTTLLVACDPPGANSNETPSAENADYSVTVKYGSEFIQGVTVNWNTSAGVAGSAVTGDNGKATASLPAGTYTVTLTGYQNGLTYTEVSVSAKMRSVIILLEVAKVTYSAKVIDKDGNPAQNVTVTWIGSSSSTQRTTGANGIASCELDYDNYTVSISNLPANNIYEGTLTAGGANPSVEFTLTGGSTQLYTVTVRSEGGIKFGNQAMLVNKGDDMIASGFTDENGVYEFSLTPGEYSVEIFTTPDGYTADPITVSANNASAELILYSSVITEEPANDFSYVMGDIIHNYSFTTPYEIDGEQKTYTLAELLETKKAVLINNWGTNCTYCVQEMPAMAAAYDKYKDDIEIIAVSNYMGGDSESTIVQYYERYGYTFPMMRDDNNLALKFGVTAWPTTIVIDRYGAVARIETGAILDDETWGRLIEKYIGDDYEQTFTPGDHVSDSINSEIAKPDITVDDDHYEQIANIINKTSQFPAGAYVKWFGETKYEYAWPFILGTDETVSPTDTVLYSSNTGKANSLSILYATVKAAPGQVFTFDYWAQTQANGDILSVVWDDKIIKEISGDSEGWKTCNLYTDLAEGEHTLAFVYIKNGSINTGKDNVYLRNVRFIDLHDITEPMDMLRGAAYGVAEKDAEFPYYATVRYDETDGYYHAVLSSLENSAFAGNDQSPLLLVNLLNSTNYSSKSIRELVLETDEKGEYKFDCTLTVNGKTQDYRNIFVKYLMTANSSDIAGCVPVDKELHDILVALLKKLSGNKTHEKEWLEACYFYSHYGAGEPVGNPIMGLTTKTAIPVEEGVNTADLTRLMYPITATIYSFTPNTSGVYKMESLLALDLAASYSTQAWLYDDSTDVEKPLVYCGDSHFTRDGVNEHNFEFYRYLEADHKYYLEVAFQMGEIGTFDFKITNVGDTVTTLMPCSDDFYWQVLDANGNFSGRVVLAGAVNYKLHTDGYYHAVNADGSVGDFIYLDVKYPSTVAGGKSLNAIVDSYVKDPKDRRTDLDYKMFDFRYRLAYYSQELEDGGSVVNYVPKFDLTSYGAEYKDYTQTMKDYIATAPTTGETDGLIKVDQQLVDILLLYIETRNNMLMDNNYEQTLPNEWLRFCWYFRTYDAQNA